MSSKHWFLPESTDLLGMLQAQAAITVEGMDALVEWAGGDVDAGAAGARLRAPRRRRQARAVAHACATRISPPLDAEDVYSLSADLDEVLNAAKDLVREMEVMKLDPDAPTHEMAALLADAVGHLADAFGCLGKADGDPTEYADAAIKSQRRSSTHTGRRCRRSWRSTTSAR